MGARTQEYSIFCACRNWGKWPSEFYALETLDEQMAILTFEDLRMEEERAAMTKKAKK